MTHPNPRAYIQILAFVSWLCLTLVTPSTTQAAEKKSENPSKRTITIDSNYGVNSNSNKSISNAALELIGVDGFIQDTALKSNSKFGRSAVVAYSLLSPITHAVQTSFHEFGHGSRDIAYGGSAVYFVGSNRDKPYNNFFSYFLGVMTDPYSGGAARVRRRFDDEKTLIVSAGGLNNQMYLAEKIQDKMLLDDVSHIAYGSTYFFGKLSTVLYPCGSENLSTVNAGNDKCSMLRQYRILGNDFSESQLDDANRASLYLSSDTYLFLKSYYDFISNGKTEVKPFIVNQFYLPNVSNYYNSKGISYKLDSGYRINNSATLVFGYEAIWSGQSQSELSVGINLRHNKYGLFLKTIAGHDSTSEVDFSYQIKQDFKAHIGVDSYNANSLYGQRNIPYYTVDNKITQYWAKISVFF